jgi:hypothetical protein
MKYTLSAEALEKGNAIRKKYKLVAKVHGRKEYLIR